MAWGGSLNKEGSDYIRKIMEADKVIKFLENLKNAIKEKEKEAVSAVIEIIINRFANNSKEDI
jgi:uncharacterized protein YeeX (DUF496 family)